MTGTYLHLLIVICVGLLGWGLIRLERVYQYPFFMSGIFLSFLVPQAIALSNNPGVVRTEAVDRILFYSSLCLLMCWIGYKLRPNIRWIYRFSYPMQPRKLMQAAWLLVFFGNTCSWLLSRITIQTDTISGNWTGPATILVFFASTSLIGGAILLVLALSYKYHTGFNLIGLSFAIYPTVNAVIGAGRRQPTATILIIIGLGLFFTRRIIPPRWLVLSLVILSAFLIPLIAQMRGGFWESLFAGTLSIDALHNAFDNLLRGEILELRNAALIADATIYTNQYGYGTGFWNAIVFQYVPGQLLGYGFKESLYIKLSNYNLTELFGYKIPIGATVTGIGDSFQEFGYLGCLVFALIAYLFKNLWVAAVYFRSFYSQVLYIGLVSPALVGLTHGIGRFLQEAIFQFIIVTIVTQYAKQKLPKNSYWTQVNKVLPKSTYE